jgi:hypothetical protein
MRNVLVVSLLMACGWSEDKFHAVGLEEWCRQAAACEGFEIDACIDHVRAAERAGCEFDPAKAKRCGKELNRDGGRCVDNGDLGTMQFLGPEPCDEVWPDCGGLFDPPFAIGTSPDTGETAPVVN